MDILSALFQQNSRHFGQGTTLLIPSVVVSEKHMDTLTVTAYPVENGATISDHAYMPPATVTMILGFAGGGALLDQSITSAITKTIGQTTPLELSPQDTYKQILGLLTSRTLIEVTTGKRQYSNMLITSIEVDTSVATEYVLSCTLTMTQVVITTTDTTKAALKVNMANTLSTSAVANTGKKTPTTPANPTVAAGNIAAN
ncbi:phage baseplate protein [Sodalis ligni]|uniref:Dit-like phage tail protein N-terminal domain-containing protein n=1 Tax=Sodalis ligni TaxID=2697027 RepID=A0A4R1NHK1_9GAMM|nr:hypothetical protein [Sodalis ligni]TCL04216.1 hypothetical protein EZJ58_2327 [Sodalis ligni]